MSSVKVDQVYIGSCTNGRIEDLRAAAAVLRAENSFRGQGHRFHGDAAVYPRRQGGLIGIFMDAGFCVTNPTCGAASACPTESSPPRGVRLDDEQEFQRRMGKGGMIHLMSPATRRRRRSPAI